MLLSISYSSDRRPFPLVVVGRWIFGGIAAILKCDSLGLKYVCKKCGTRKPSWWQSENPGAADCTLFSGRPNRSEHAAFRFAQHVETRQLYAIKVFSVFDREKRAQLLKEVETLWGMECPSLINFVGGYLKVRGRRAEVCGCQRPGGRIWGRANYFKFLFSWCVSSSRCAGRFEEGGGLILCFTLRSR